MGSRLETGVLGSPPGGGVLSPGCTPEFTPYRVSLSRGWLGQPIADQLEPLAADTHNSSETAAGAAPAASIADILSLGRHSHEGPEAWPCLEGAQTKGRGGPTEWGEELLPHPGLGPSVQVRRGAAGKHPQDGVWTAGPGS